MTGRTHDLAAFTALVLVGATYPIPHMSFATAIVALGANMLGALTPDLDEPTVHFWNRLPAGSIIGRIIHPLLGGHRMISHSIVGLLVIGFLMKWLLGKVGTVLLVDMEIVWWTFMIGYISHLVTDMFTKDGLPLFFPLPIKIGFPPFKFMRLTTGGFAEKALVFPSLMILTGYTIYQNYGKFLSFLTSLGK